MGVLHHTPDAAKAVDEIFRVLKPGGRLIVNVYHRNSLLYRFKLPLMSLVTRKPVQQLMNEVDGVGNPKGSVFSKGELRRLLKKFRDIDLFVGLLQGWMFFPKGGRLFPDRCYANLRNMEAGFYMRKEGSHNVQPLLDQEWVAVKMDSSRKC